MKTKINFGIIFILLFIFSQSLHSQNSGDLSKIVTGKYYKITLFDDTEIFGKIIAVDSAGVKVETDNKNVVVIPINNLLFYSSESKPTKYRACFSLLGGISIPVADNYYNGYGPERGPNFNASVMFFLSDTKAFKIDVDYSYLKKNINYYAYPVGDPVHPAIYSGGNYLLYSAKFNILLGMFSPAERFTYYGSLGVGLHLTKQQDFYADYWSFNYYNTGQWEHYTVHNTYPYEGKLLFSLGASLGYRITKNFGIKSEIEYDLASYFFFDGKSYFPFRVGVFYVF